MLALTSPTLTMPTYYPRGMTNLRDGCDLALIYRGRGCERASLPRERPAAGRCEICFVYFHVRSVSSHVTPVFFWLCVYKYST